MFPGSGTGDRIKRRRKPLCFSTILASFLPLVLTILTVPGWISPIMAGEVAGESDIEVAELVDMNSLGTSLAGLVDGSYGDFGIYLLIPDTGEETGYQADKAFYAASCYKVCLVLYIYERAAAGAIDLNSTVTYASDDYSEGAGVIQYLPSGRGFGKL